MKKVFRRLLSFPLCILMVLCMVPSAIVTPVKAVNTNATVPILYLSPNANWRSNGARFAIYMWGPNNTNKWVNMSDSDGDGIYQASVPNGEWTEFYFCRMNGSTTANNFDNRWNKTVNLSFSAGNVLYTIDEGAWSQGGGSWSMYYGPINQSTFYLSPNYRWTEANARFVMYLLNRNGQNAWVDMTDADGDGTYQANVPTGTTWSHVIFCRMNPNNLENRWNTSNEDGRTKPMWGKTAVDISPAPGQNWYIITEGDWTGGNATNPKWSLDYMASSAYTAYSAEARTIYVDNTVYNWYSAQIEFYGTFDGKEHRTVASGSGFAMTRISPYLFKYVLPLACYVNGSVSITGSGGIGGGSSPSSGEASVVAEPKLVNADGTWEPLAVMASLATGTAFSGELDLTFYCSEGVTGTTFTLSGAGVPAEYTTATSFTNGQNIVVPVDDANVAFGTTVTLTVSGTKDGQAVSKTYTYEKGRKFYAEKPDDWDTVFATVINSSTPTSYFKNVKDPGIEMTYNSRTRLYEFVVVNEGNVSFIDHGNNKFSFYGNSSKKPAGKSEKWKKNKFTYNGNSYSYKLSPKDTTYQNWNIYPPLDISEAEITLSAEEFNYDGTEKTITYSATLNGKALTLGTDYIFEGHASATEPGIYVVKIKGIGDYTNYAKTNWRILDSVVITVDGVEKTGTIGKSFSAFVPETKDGKTFSHWVDGAGNVVSYSARYSFVVEKSVTLTSVYENIPEEKETVLSLKTAKSTYNGKNAIAFTFTHSVPEGYEMEEAGLLYATNKLAGADTNVPGYATVNLVGDTTLGVANVESVVKNQQSKVKKFVASYTNNDGMVQFYYAVGDNTTAYTYAVGYIKVRNTDTGAEETIYSDFIATTYSSIV